MHTQIFSLIEFGAICAQISFPLTKYNSISLVLLEMCTGTPRSIVYLNNTKLWHTPLISVFDLYFVDSEWRQLLSAHPRSTLNNYRLGETVNDSRQRWSAICIFWNGKPESPVSVRLQPLSRLLHLILCANINVVSATGFVSVVVAYLSCRSTIGSEKRCRCGFHSFGWYGTVNIQTEPGGKL